MIKISNKVKGILIALLILIPINGLAAEKNPDDLPARTYIIGTHEFSPGTAMTTQRIMWAARTIKGKDVKPEDMVILYKNVEKKWINTVSKKEFKPAELPATIVIEYKDEILLEDIKTNNVDALISAYNSYKETDYTTTSWNILNTFFNNGKAAIKVATTTDIIDKAKQTAIDGMKSVKTIQQQLQQLQEAKTTKKNAADALLTELTQDDYTVASWTVLTEAIAADKVAIDALETVEAVEGYTLTATAAKAALVTKVLISAISVSPETLTLTAGGATGTITVTFDPTNATNKNVTWTSSNEAVATVAGGVVTPLTAGTTTITATTVDGSFTANTTVTVEVPVVGAKTEFLEALDTETAKLAPVATVERTGDNLTVNFRSDVSSSDVLNAAVGLAEALGTIADGTSTLTVGGLTITLADADADALIALATALLNGKTPAEFLADGQTISSLYTASIDYDGGTFGLDGSVTFEVTKAGTKAEFLAELDTETAKLAPVATVERTGDNLTVNFRSDVSSSDVLNAAVGLAEALGTIADGTSTLTVGGLTITLADADADALIALATALLNGKTPAEFLADGQTISSLYTASIDYDGGTFGLDGSVTFEVTKAGTKAEFLAELDTETAKLAPVATVERTGDNLTVNFRSDVSSSDVLNAAVGLAEALGTIADGTSTLTVGGLTITLADADADALIALATALLNGKTPAEFLADGQTISSLYTASIDYDGGTFGLDGSVTFEVTKAGTKAEFLAELDTETAKLAPVATVERTGDNLTVNFRSDVSSSDVLNAAVGLAEALGTIADGTSTLTVGGLTITLADADADALIALATALLNGKTPAEFLADGQTISSLYTASIDYDGGTFPLSGTISFTAVQ